LLIDRVFFKVWLWSLPRYFLRPELFSLNTEVVVKQGFSAAFLNLFLPQHPFLSRLSSPAPPTIGKHLVTIRINWRKLQYILIICTYVTFPSTPWNWFQHPPGVLAPQVKKPCFSVLWLWS